MKHVIFENQINAIYTSTNNTLKIAMKQPVYYEFDVIKADLRPFTRYLTDAIDFSYASYPESQVSLWIWSDQIVPAYIVVKLCLSDNTFR